MARARSKAARALAGWSALHEKGPETVEGRRARAPLGRALERDERRSLEALVEQLPAVGQVVARARRGMERPRERQGARETLGRRGLDPGRVPQDLGRVHAVAVDLDHPPLRVEEEGRGQR